jgi:predicted kinase
MKATVMMGLPGSGKSTWVGANALDPAVCSADNFHIGEDGVYRFDPARAGEAHAKCLRDYIRLCQQAHPHVAVDNTNVREAEIAPYIAIARAYGYEVHVVYIDAPVRLCKSRNTHGVPLEVIDAMRDNLERTLSSWPHYWPLIEKVHVTTQESDEPTDEELTGSD